MALDEIGEDNLPISSDSSASSEEYSSDEASNSQIDNHIVPRADSVDKPLYIWDSPIGAIPIFHRDICDCGSIEFCTTISLLYTLGHPIRTYSIASYLSSGYVRGTIVNKYNIDAIYLLLLWETGMQSVTVSHTCQTNALLPNLVRQVWKDEGAPLSPRRVIRAQGGGSAVVAKHWERIMRADTRYPILIIDLNGYIEIIDGYHRLAKAYTSKEFYVHSRLIPRIILEECNIDAFDDYPAALISMMVNRAFDRIRARNT